MAIDKKLIFWKKQSTFNAPSSTTDTTGSVMWYSIVFFKDTGQIWTNGTYYNCGIWGTPQTNYVPLTIGGTTYNLSRDGHTHAYLPLSGASYVQSSGYSTTWGTSNGTLTGAYNTIMGTTTSATWLLSGTSGGIFRAGIQALDSNGEMRFYVGTNYMRYDGANLYIGNGLVYNANNFNPSDYSLATHTHDWNKINAGVITDFDIFRTVSFQHASAGGGNNVLNKPAGTDAFGALSFQTAGGWWVQLVRSSNTDTSWKFRDWNGNSWGTWYKLWDSQNFNPANYLQLSGGTMTGKITLSANQGILSSDGYWGILFDDGVNTITGMQKGTHFLRSGNSSLIHRKDGTDYKVWDESNDGHNSGLDADTVDGIHLSAILPYGTIRNFPNGTLIQTSINYSVSNGSPFYLEIKGNTYTRNYSCFTQAQGYIYNDTIINYSVTHLGFNGINNLTAFNYNGNLCFWFPNQGYWEGYAVTVVDAGDSKYNRVTSVSNSAKPVDITKEVVISSQTKSAAFTDSNVASATKLANTRTIWGQNFNGEGNVSGALSGATTGSFTSTISATTGIFSNLTSNYIPKHTAGGLANSIIFDNGTNVSIGRTGTLYGKLEVSGVIRGNTESDVMDTSSWTAMNANYILTSNSGWWGIRAATNHSFNIDVTSNGYQAGMINALRILTNGNVGINTSSPAHKLDVNGNVNAARFFSTQATGTSPFTVSSTTLVSNLNADMLDGLHAKSNSNGNEAWGYIPIVEIDGVMQVGRYLDFNHSSGIGVDYNVRLHTNGVTDGELYINSNKIWHAGNFNPSNYLPLTGGNVTGNTTIKGGTNVFEYTLRLAKGNYADTGGHTTLIGFGVETIGWSKSAIGHTRTGSYDRGYLGFYINNSIDTTSATASDLKMSIDSSGLVWSNGGFSKQGSSDSYVLLGAGGHKLISDFTDDDRNKGVNNVTTLTSLPISKRLIYATVTAATSISLSSAMEVGSELHIVVYNSSAAAVTQVLPNTGAFISMSGSSISISATGYVEINILCHATGSYIIRAGGVSW